MRSPLHGRGAHRNRDRGRPDGRFRDESGSILVLFSIFLVMFLLCCAVVVDVGYWWVAGKRAQIAADACALAAARDLPEDWDPARSECVFNGQDWVLVNLPDQSGADPEPLHRGTTVLSPYDGESSQVEAIVEMRVRTFFGRVVGLPVSSISLGGLSPSNRPGQGNMAIYVNSTDCDPGESLEFDGKDMHISGLVHTEGGLWSMWTGLHPAELLG